MDTHQDTPDALEGPRDRDRCHANPETSQPADPSPPTEAHFDNISAFSHGQQGWPWQPDPTSLFPLASAHHNTQSVGPGALPSEQGAGQAGIGGRAHQDSEVFNVPWLREGTDAPTQGYDPMGTADDLPFPPVTMLSETGPFTAPQATQTSAPPLPWDQLPATWASVVGNFGETAPPEPDFTFLETLDWLNGPMQGPSQDAYALAQPSLEDPSTTSPVDENPSGVFFSRTPDSGKLVRPEGLENTASVYVEASADGHTGSVPAMIPTPGPSTPTSGLGGDGSGKGLEIVHYGQESNARKKKKRSGVDLTTSQKVMRYEDSDRLQGFQIIMGTPNHKVKGPYDAKAKQDAARCRESGACESCHKGHRKCDRYEKSVYEPCSRCATTRRYKGVPRFLCFESQISECIFFRKGPSFRSPLYFERQSVYNLNGMREALEGTGPPTQPRKLELSQLPGETLTVYVAHFDQQPGDKLNCVELDEDGKEQVLEMPHYCLTDMEIIQRNMRVYIRRTRGRYLELLRNGSDITRLAARTAMDYGRRFPDSMTSMALEMWAYCRVIERQWKICGEDTLGVEAPEDPKSPWAGFVPVTPVMDVQLDQIVIQGELSPLRTRLLVRLDSVIRGQEPEDWFDCCLTIYILLNHVERAATHGNSFSKQHGLNRRFSDMTLASGWFHSCKILLSRFHFISNGSAPFRLDWGKPEKIHFTRIDETQLSFIHQMQDLIKSRDDDFDDLRTKNRYERDLYWTHQLFARDWIAGSPNIADEELD